MTLSPGTKLGPYEILSPIGAGGMGEVYKARDTRLDRTVAIKLSAEKFGERFEREARAVASLNHPNICQLYDVGPNYLVMELVEGPTLAERIHEGAIPLEEALALARQIADALEAAHEKGIVHRDLKPANIKIRPDGTVKVLDFGLAKRVEPLESSEDSPTAAMDVTREGQILGTAAYMAPEQARGRQVDKRADIWAFGVVLYEMLTGRRLFAGESVTDILAAVLNKEPQWERVPPKARRLLRNCLEKDPKRRLRDIGDAWCLLDESPAEPATRSRLWPAAAAALALALAVALFALFRLEVPSAPPPVVLDLDLGPDASLATSIGSSAVLSPDGTRLAFVSQANDGTRSLFTRRLEQPEASALSKTEGAYAPFFSPDGEWVGFFAGGKLKKTRIDGGEPISLCDAPAGRGASWGDDGHIIAALDSQVGLSQVPPEGGTAIPITELDFGEVSHRWPQVLPGSKAVLFSLGTGYGNFDGAGIAVVSLVDHRRKIVHREGMYPRYLPSGHLVYVTKGMLFAVPFDLDRLEVRGPATSLQEVSSDPTLGSAQVDFSRNGTILYRSGRTEGRRTLQWLDGEGKTESLGNEPGDYLFPRLSPDGSRLLVRVTERASSDIWIYDLERGSKARLTNGVALSSWPVWSHDGRYVIFQSAGGMFWTRADGAGGLRPLTESKTLQFPTSFSPDGALLVFSELTSGGESSIRTLPVENRSGELRAGEPASFLETSNANAYAAFSPDGRWMAYADAESGRYEVYVRAFPDKGSKVQISNAGGMMPVWSRSARELFYRTEDQRIMVANYAVKEETFVAEKPRVWLGERLANTGLAANFDLAPDGMRFVVLMPEESSERREKQSHVKIAVNFFDEIRRRVAAQSK